MYLILERDGYGDVISLLTIDDNTLESLMYEDKNDAIKVSPVELFESILHSSMGLW
jgi:hypothetical protein